LRGLLLLAIATAVFSLVNIAISTIPDTLVVGGDIGELCNATVAPAPTPTPTPTTPHMLNISFYEPFNILNTHYWRNLSHPWVVANGYARTTVSDSSYDNAIYYVVDFTDDYHDSIYISASVRTESAPGYNMLERGCVFLATNDLSVRIFGCIETFNSARAYYYVYARVRVYRHGSVTLLRSETIEGSAYSTIVPGTRTLTLIVTKINETHVNIVLSGTRSDGTAFSLSPVTTAMMWSSLGYFGLHATRPSDSFDYVNVLITSQNATSTVYYNVDFPPPLPTTVTVTVTERMGLGGDGSILVLPVGSIARFLSFVFYIAYIVGVIKHFIPEF
jgi:hypothetical protein